MEEKKKKKNIKMIRSQVSFQPGGLDLKPGSGVWLKSQVEQTGWGEHTTEKGTERWRQTETQS